jgi:hypothetical protein
MIRYSRRLRPAPGPIASTTSTQAKVRHGQISRDSLPVSSCPLILTHTIHSVSGMGAAICLILRCRRDPCPRHRARAAPRGLKARQSRASLLPTHPLLNGFIRQCIPMLLQAPLLVIGDLSKAHFLQELKYRHTDPNNSCSQSMVPNEFTLSYNGSPTQLPAAMVRPEWQEDGQRKGPPKVGDSARFIDSFPANGLSAEPCWEKATLSGEALFFHLSYTTLSIA